MLCTTSRFCSPSSVRSTPRIFAAAADSFAARFDRSVRRRLAVGHVDEVNLVPLRRQPDDRAAHAEFLIVRMRADDED